MWALKSFYEALDEDQTTFGRAGIEGKNAFEESGYEDVHALREITVITTTESTCRRKALMGESLNPEMASLLQI